MFNITHYQRNANQNRMRYHFMPDRIAAIQKFTSNKCWRGVEKREPSHSVDGNAIWYSNSGKQCGDALKTGNRTAL